MRRREGPGRDPAPSATPAATAEASGPIGSDAPVLAQTRERRGGVAGSTHVSYIGEESPASVLVSFQRQGAGGATLDTMTVRRDGTARLDKRYGGAGGRFKDLGRGRPCSVEQLARRGRGLRRGELAKLRAALARVPRSGDSLTRGRPPAGGARYLLRYRGRTFTAREGGVVRAARPAVRVLDGIGIRAR